METAFWVAPLAVVFAYFGYPLLLILAGSLAWRLVCQIPPNQAHP